MFNSFRSSKARIPTSAPMGFADPKVTAADILACFRLLLGRSPKPEEWPLHAGRIGGDLQALVASFATSPEFINRNLLPPLTDLTASSASPSFDHEANTPSGKRIATAADVYYCFRLLLGRPPNREEWLGHVAQAGSDLDRVVANYTASLEFAERKLGPVASQSNVSLIQQNGFQLYVADDDAAVGQHVAGGAYEPDVTAVLRRLLSPGMSMIDIGANIGYFTMLAASIVGPSGHVLAVEPNPRNARLLEASRRANNFSQVKLCQSAAGPELGLLVLNTMYSNGTTTRADGDIDRLLAAETVPCLPIDNLIEPAMRIDVIKIDVEGAEHSALLGCQRILRDHRPVIASEFSPSLLAGISGISGPDYLNWLIGQGYGLGVIAPDGSVSAITADPEIVMDVYRAREVDHIDIIAMPQHRL